MAWNRSTENEKSAAQQSAAKPAWLKGAIAGGIIVLGAILAFLFLLPSEKPQQEEKTETKSESLTGPADEDRSADKVVRRSGSSKRSANAAVAPALDQKDVKDGVSTLSGKENGNQTNSVKKQVFEKETDQLIAMATGVPEGCLIPPLPKMSDADTARFIENLKTPIKVDEADSDAVKSAKTRVQEVRNQIAEWMKEEPGKSLDEILNGHRDDSNYITTMQTEVKNGLQEYLDSGDKDGAAEYLETMNQALRQVGVPDVTIPVENVEE